MPKRLNIVALNPYHGGSHAAFLDSLIETSRHNIHPVTMPARKWKWRMRGAAIWFTHEDTNWFNTQSKRSRGGNLPVHQSPERSDGVQQSRDRKGAVECAPHSIPNQIPRQWDTSHEVQQPSAPDAILCTDMLSVADLRALLPQHLRNIPIICYFHENQLTYPLHNLAPLDYQYGMTNITSCLAADAVLFNSAFHRCEFLEAARTLLRKMPDYVPHDIVNEIDRKSTVCPPPLVLKPAARKPKPNDAPLTILWSHRWERDKNPAPFFEVLTQLSLDGFRFDLVLLGESFRTASPVFAEIREVLRSHIRHIGHIPDRGEYAKRLATCDVVVSTANQENFGLAVLEAIISGCQPVLPARLSYPELIPDEYHKFCLYGDDADLLSHLKKILSAPCVPSPSNSSRMNATQKDQLAQALITQYSPQATTAKIDTAIENCLP